MKRKKKYYKQRVEQLERQMSILIEKPESTEAKIIIYRYRLAKQMKAVCIVPMLPGWMERIQKKDSTDSNFMKV